MKNNLTVTRGEVGGDNGGKWVKRFQEQLQKTHGQNQGGWDQGWEVGMAGVGGRGGGKWSSTVPEQQEKKEKKKDNNKFKNKQTKPGLAENQNAWKSDNQGVKEETFT